MQTEEKNKRKKEIGGLVFKSVEKGSKQQIREIVQNKGGKVSKYCKKMLAKRQRER